MCGMYREAPARVAAGERIISTDEMTGVQALERAAPGLPLRPGKVERREFEYIRHGTLSFMINFDVVTGEVICPSVGPTRTEVDFLAHIRGTVESDPSTSQEVLSRRVEIPPATSWSSSHGIASYEVQIEEFADSDFVGAAGTFTADAQLAAH